MGQGVSAHVDEDDQIHAERGSRGGDPVRQLGRTQRGVHEHGLLTEQFGHPRLRKEHPGLTHARACGRRHHARREPPRALDLRLGAWPGLRIDRPALPADPANHGLRAVHPARLGCGERAHHVATSADPKHQRAPGAGQQLVGVDHPRTARAIDSG